MLRDLLVGLVMALVVEPFSADMERALAAAQAPEPAMREAAACARAAAPALTDRALADWSWAAATGIRAAAGIVPLETIIIEASPSCAGAIAEAKRFLGVPRT